MLDKNRWANSPSSGYELQRAASEVARLVVLRKLPADKYKLAGQTCTHHM